MPEGDRASFLYRGGAAVLFALTVAVVVPYLRPSARTAPTLISESRPLKEKTRLHVTLAVAVLSARNRLEKRRSLRETWAGFAKALDKVFFRFVVGNESCHLPPEKRIDEYSCRLAAVVPEGKLFGAVSVQSGLLSLKKGVHCEGSDTPLGLDFEVLQTAVITDLGLFDFAGNGFQGNSNVSVWDTVAQKEIVTVTFSPVQQGQLRDGFRYLSVPNYVFPTGFLGSIVVSNFAGEDLSCSGPFPETVKVRLSSDGVVKVLGRSRKGHATGRFPVMTESIFPAPRFLAGSFLHRLHVQENTDQKMRSMPGDSFSGYLAEEEMQLQEEMRKHSDVEIMPVMDIYRNLPRKLLLYFQWLSDQIRFDYVLKTDDDCFVNIPLVLLELSRWQVPVRDRLWWGNFRQDWAVERFGKWRELDYRSSTYPPFACGAGNVLSAELVKWLARNSDELHCFQGEDVSLGIWLSSVLVGHLDDWRWQCFSNCSNDALAIPNLSDDELQRFWRNVASSGCGKVCGCNRQTD